MTAKTTFCKLIERHGRVEIPVIQRDYAQGRADQQIVRDDFLKSMHDALCLPKDDPFLPLDLDFIYGSVVNGAFQPLDGQQRLTTLFLLHWYLAWIDGCSEDFRARIVTPELSRFCYEVRPSSRDFINAFANFLPNVSAADCDDFFGMITDQPWFFRSWRFDPTIRSALSMLVRMHEVFRQTSGLYARLIDEASPGITFQLLDLEQFDLSDDLYIKMNARGKPLTPFETFKARFERHLEIQFKGISPNVCNGVQLADFFSQRIDTRWSDFFWPFRDYRNATFDDAMMNLLRTVIMVTRAPESAATAADLADLRNPARPSSFTWFHEKAWLDHEMILALVTLLERWSVGPEPFRCYLANTRHFDERALFREIIARPTAITYQQLVLFAGYVQYLVHSRGEIEPAAFDTWMRVVSNLATNTDYNRPEDLRRSFGGLRDIVLRMNDILSHLASLEGDVRGFFRDQVAEERIKAHLIGFGDGWPERIDRAERHTYFRGQIGFLLRSCSIDLNKVDSELMRLDAAAANALVRPFEHYLACAAKMFDDLMKDPKVAGRLWERALLAVGDFLPLVGRNNSLLTTDLDQAWGWKRLLRNAAAGGRPSQVLKDLWDRIEGPTTIAENLTAIIGSRSNIDPWRDAIIATPSVYDYGLYRMLRFAENGGVYLLKKSQMNGKHAELFTYCLYEDLRVSSELTPMRIYYHETNSTNEEPGLYLTQDFGDEVVNLYLSLGTHDGYILFLYEPVELSNELRATLEDEGFEEKQGRLIKKCQRTEMKTQIRSLALALAQEAQ